MKTIFRNTIASAVLLVAFSSCSSDDSKSGTSVRYEISTSADMFESITFKAANGTASIVPLENLQTSWAKTINVTPPFTATVQVQFKNTGTETEDYTIKIFVDDELATSVPGTVSAGITTSNAAEFEITN